MLRETANVFQMESEVHQLNPSWCFVDSIGLIAPVRSTLAVPGAPASSTQQARPSKLDPAMLTSGMLDGDSAGGSNLGPTDKECSKCRMRCVEDRNRLATRL